MDLQQKCQKQWMKKKLRKADLKVEMDRGWGRERGKKGSKN